MKRFSTRVLSFLLILALVVSALASMLSVSALSTNTATRHQVCTQLSSQAKSYYTGQYTYDNMSQLEGGTTSCLEAVNSPLYKSLHNLMETTMTNSVTYKKLTSYWPDTDNNLLIYSDKKTSSNISREHVWPKSRASFHESGGGSDLHHLRPEDATINSTRGNYTMGNVRGVISGYSTKSYDGKDVLYYSSGRDLVEVNDNIKGDVARILLYVYVRWEEPNLFEQNPNPVLGSGDEKNDGKKVIESLDTLLQWCEMDPVDEWEMRRNDLCQDVQHNRNIFIDYPEYAWLLFGQELPTDMVTPSGEAKNSAPQYTITAKSENEAYGTVSLNGKTITATPKTGYTVAGYEVTPAGAATVTQSGNTFTVSNVKSDCTVTIKFAAKTAATITYIVPSGVTVSGTTASYVGDSVKLASVSGTPTGTEGYTFFGWATKSILDTTVQPSVQKAGASYTVNAAQTTFYAVFTYLDGTTTHYLSNPCKHENTHTETIKPTCTENGATNVVCDACGAIISSTPIAKTGHSYEDTVVAPTCDKKGYTQHTCTVCGESYKNTYVSALGHDYVSKVTKPATDTEDGVLTYTCTRCGTSYTEVIPATVHDCPCDDFTDLDNTKWYHEGVDLMLNKGYMKGIGNGKFDPNGSTTRAMIVTIIWRMEGQPAPSGKNPFTDVQANAWYTDAITWAAENDVVNGMGDNKFDPNARITREQMATILFRYANGNGADTTARTSLSSFPDGGKVQSWAKDAMQWAVSESIIQGDGALLQPQGTTTRAQAATILYRSMDLFTK